LLGQSHRAGTIAVVKILHTSDWHVGRTIRGRSRAEEHRAVLAEIAGIAGTEGTDLILVAGDLFDVVAPSPESEQIVFRGLLDLADIAPVVIVAGNHDHPRRLEAVSPLLELGRVRVGATLKRPEEGGVITIDTGSGETARIALVPFVSQRAIVSAGDLMALDPDQHGGRYAGRLAGVIAKLTGGVSPDQVNLVVAHLMVAGGTLGGGERSAHTIFDYAVSAQAFDGSLSYVALGHLHRPQEVLDRARPVYEAFERRQEEALVDQIVNDSAAGGPGVVGAGDTIRALNEGRIRTLVVGDAVAFPGAECPSCGMLTEQPQPRCPACEAETDELPDIVERAVQRIYLNHGGVEVVFGKAAEKLAANGGIGAQLGQELHRITGTGIILQVLAYLVRSGSPDSLDLMVATNYASMAADLAMEGARGRLVALRGGTYTNVPLTVTREGVKRVDVEELYDSEQYRPQIRHVGGKPMFLY